MVTQAVNREQTLGLIPRIDYERLGQVMQEAVSAGIQDSQKGTSQPTSGRDKVPDVGGVTGAPRGAQRGQAGRGGGKFPALGMSGLMMMLGGRLMNNGGSGLDLAPQAQVHAFPGRSVQFSAPSAQVQMPSVPGAPSPDAGPSLTPMTEGGGGGFGGGGGGVGGLAGAAEGGEAGEAGGALAGAAEAAGGIGLRQVLGAGMAGFGAKGVAGAWEGMAGAAPELAGALSAAALPIGVLAGAYGGIMKIGSIVSSEREQGAYYQSILGGTNIGGQEQRLQQTGFRYSQLGNLSGAQANALFQGTTNLAMTGGQRQNAMDTAIQLYDQLGVSVQSSIQNITIAAQSGNKELNNLAQAIGTVTSAAVAGGMNANAARANFTQLYGAATQNVQGPGATTAAGGFAAAQAQGGQLIQGANTSGFMSQQAMLMYASQTGQSYGQIVAGIQSGTLNVGQLAQNSFTSQLSQSGAMDNISKAIDQIPGLRGQISSGKQLTDTQIEQVVTQMGANGDSQDFFTLQSMLQTLYPGNTFTSAQAVDFAVEAATGRWDPGKQQAKIQQKWSQRTFSLPKPVPPARALGTAQAKKLAPTTAARTAEDKYRYGIQENYLRQRIATQNPTMSAADRQKLLSQQMASWSKGQTAQEGADYSRQLAANAFQQDPNDVAQYRQAQKAIGAPSEESQLWSDVFGSGQDVQARNWYMKNVVQGKGQRDPVMEALLKNPDLNNAQTLFRVNTQGGGSVLATVQDLQQRYMKQVQSGNVTIAAANNQQLVGNTLASQLGFQATSQGSQAGLHYQASAAGKAEQAKLQSQLKGETKNVITVVPSQALLQWMQFNANSGSNVAIDNNTATNSTAPAYPTPAAPIISSPG
jgi:hypothetical protein